MLSIKQKNSNKFNSFNRNSRYQELRVFIIVFVLILIIMSSSYAYMVNIINGKNETEIVAGTLKIIYKDKNQIKLENAYPMTDEQGMNTEPYQFTIENAGNLKGKYTVNLEETAGNTLDKSNIRYSIKEGNGSWSEVKFLEEGIELKNDGVLNGGDKVTYQIKLWLKENAKNEVQGLTYQAKIVVAMVQENANLVSTTNPVVRLNGEKEVKIIQGSTYVENGVKDIISKETLNVSSVSKRYEYYNGTTTTTVSGVDTSQVGIYYIYYEITDSQGLKGIATRVVNVTRKDATPPVITLSGENPKVLDYNTEYVEPGYTSVDDQDGTITDKVIIVGTVNKEIPGTYTIKYISIDTLGNISSKTREVIVEKAAKEVTMGSLRVDNWILTSRIDVSLDSKADKAYYSVKETEQKPSDNEYEEMTTRVAGTNGYYTYTASKTIYENGTYYVYTKDSNGEVKEKVIVIDNIDTTKPTCTFSNIQYVGYQKTAKAELTCTDIVDTKNPTITLSDLEVSDTTLVELVSVTTKERIGEDAPRGEQKGYKYEITLRGKKTGTFTLSLKKDKIEDTVGRKNDRLEKTGIKVTKIDANNPEVELDLTRTNTHQIEVTGINAGNLSYVSSNTSIATVSSSGVITGVWIGTTTITVTEANGGATTTVDVTVVKTLDVILEKGNNVDGIGSTALSCTSRVSSGKCSITLPSITPSRGYDVDGWYEGTTKIGSPAGSYEISENKTIVGKSVAQKYTIVYDCNGGSKPSGKLGNAEATYDQTFTVATDKCTKNGYTQMYWEDPTGDRTWTGWSGTWKYINGQYGITNRTITLKAIYYTNVTVPTETTYCKSLTYSGSDETLVKSAATGFSWTAGTLRKKAGTQSVTAHLDANYIWNDGSLTDKNITCGISKATPIIELSAATGSAYTTGTSKFTATVKSGSTASSAGTLSVASGNTTYATVSPTSTSVTATTNGVGTEETVTAKSSNGTSVSSATITINFTPSDTENFNSAVQKTYTMTVNPYVRKATFNPNNNTLSTPSGCTKNASTGVVECSCTSSGTSTSCNITAPTITANTNTPSICGFSGSSTGVRTGCTGNGSSITLTGSPPYYAQTYSDKSGTFDIQDSNSATKSGGSTSCTAYNGAANCTITAPKLTNKTGYTVVGWKKDGSTSSTSSDLASTGSATVSISSNVTYKSVTYYNTPITITFNKNGASTQTNSSGTAVTDNTVTRSCYRYNGSNGCNIATPTIVAASGFNVLGYNTSSTSTSSSMSHQATVTVTTSTATTYYAITRSAIITVTFNDNGGVYLSGSTMPQCYRYNGASTCTVSSPTIDSIGEGWEVLGYNTSPDSYTNNSNYNTSTKKLTVSSSGDWYVISRKQLTVTFSRNTTEISNSLSATTGSCYVWNGGTSCATSYTPTFTANDGYVAVGFFESASGTITTSSTKYIPAHSGYILRTSSSDLSEGYIKSGTTIYARARFPIASEVGYSNSSTGLKCVTSGKGCTTGAACTETQCALDALASLLQ